MYSACHSSIFFALWLVLVEIKNSKHLPSTIWCFVFPHKIVVRLEKCGIQPLFWCHLENLQLTCQALLSCFLYDRSSREQLSEGRNYVWPFCFYSRNLLLYRTFEWFFSGFLLLFIFNPPKSKLQQLPELWKQLLNKKQKKNRRCSIFSFATSS